MTKRGVEWLSAASEEPSVCQAVWRENPRLPYLLPTGRLFDVVVVPQRVGLEVFDQLVRRQMPVGPVMTDRRAQQVGFFLNSDWRKSFEDFVCRETDSPPEYKYLDDGSYVVVPGPMPLAGDRYEWLRAPLRRPEANPQRPAALAVMLVAAADLVARVEHYGERYSTPAAVASQVLEEAGPDAQ
ncbi:bifunctional DNA primase/polymerase [Streptomyces sp. TLI_146]|uniref:bifunctional DNA primase/polymerase n=1 Tax=Streptomyces sp. TLI_146 TaxID=1938858 RepID=UPI000CB929B9|nr:bifunctional DNA primase/polymerase [Streptomyces sp. TLI_146]PKV87886.1 bifunctional DNA primase/polymerase-like protein [Streptomyces sp. TLI_146]